MKQIVELIPKICPNCNGQGQYYGPFYYRDDCFLEHCNNCDGTGKIMELVITKTYPFNERPKSLYNVRIVNGDGNDV